MLKINQDCEWRARCSGFSGSHLEGGLWQSPVPDVTLIPSPFSLREKGASQLSKVPLHDDQREHQRSGEGFRVRACDEKDLFANSIIVMRPYRPARR